MRLLRITAVMAVALALFAAPGKARAGTAPVVVIFMENEDYGRIIGNAGQAPFINHTLVPGGMLATHDTSVAGWGSLPNYIAATSGTTDRGVKPPYKVNNLFNQLQQSGHTQRSYEEGMPKPCFLGGESGSGAGIYDKTHDPEAYYADIVTNATLCKASIVPAGPGNTPSTLIADAKAGRLADFNFVTPNDCNNMHSCSIATGDRWLSNVVPPLAAAGAKVIVTWDEGSTDKYIPLIEYGAGVSPGTTYTTAVNHYSLLAGLEDYFGQPRLGQAAGIRALPL